MAKYTTQGEEVLPSQGGQRIQHLCRIFESTDHTALGIEVTVFFEQLRLVEDFFPIIKSVQYSTTTLNTAPPPSDVLFTALVWYILSS